MKRRICFLILTVFFFCHSALAVAPITRLPSEILILQLPEETYRDWKEISRCVSEKNALVEYIPLDQRNESWSQLISIHYYDRSMIQNSIASLGQMIEVMRKEIVSRYPGVKVSWKVIQKNKSDFIFEWILYQHHENSPPQHEIARAFLTDSGLHRVGFTRKYSKMSPAEREKWISLLQESSSLVRLETALKEAKKLSITDKIKDTISLGEAFKDWKEINTFAFDTGYTIVTRIPPGQNEERVLECVETTTMPNVRGLSVGQLFEREKQALLANSKKIKFNVLYTSPIETIYSFAYPNEDKLIVNGVVRLFITDYGYYSICYKHGLPEKLSKDEIQKWKERLKAVKVRRI